MPPLADSLSYVTLYLIKILCIDVHVYVIKKKLSPVVLQYHLFTWSLLQEQQPKHLLSQSWGNIWGSSTLALKSSFGKISFPPLCWWCDAQWQCKYRTPLKKWHSMIYRERFEKKIAFSVTSFEWLLFKVVSSLEMIDTDMHGYFHDNKCSLSYHYWGKAGALLGTRGSDRIFLEIQFPSKKT